MPCWYVVPGLVLIALQASAADDAIKPVQIPGGVANATGTVGYLTAPDGGINAVDLEKGTVLWESHEAGMPLIVMGHRLVALSAGKKMLRTLVLDTRNKGKKLFESEPIEMPDWLELGRGSRNARVTYAFQARVSRDVLTIHWWTCWRYWGGHLCETKSGLTSVCLKSGKFLQMEHGRQESAVRPEAGLTNKPLPRELLEVAKRERWQAITIVGSRAYGLVHKVAKASPKVEASVIQAVDLQTCRVIWQRAFEEYFVEVVPD